MHSNSQERGKKGFTLIELLIVIGIIGFLAAAVLVAVDPVGRIQEARDARRYSEVNAILNAILNKQVDDRALYNGVAGHLIISSDTLAQIIVSTANAANCTTAAPTCTDGPTLQTGTSDCYANLSTLAPTYIASIPLDPATGVANNTQYYIRRNTSNRIEIGACNAEKTATIKVTR